jgi:hypothetical protein
MAPQLRRISLGSGQTISQDPVQDALKRHADRWRVWGPVIDNSPVENHPIGFSARAKTEVDAQTIAAALRKVRYEIIDIEKTWWPLFRRWRVIALTEPMPITRESTERWVAETARLLSQCNGVLELWAPAEKRPAA